MDNPWRLRLCSFSSNTESDDTLSERIDRATGFIGKHVLFDALVDNRVTKVTVVGRRPPSLDSVRMQEAKSAIVQKLTIITREDLSVWDYKQDTELVSALADCRACIWCLGGKVDDFATPEEFERVSHTFTLNAAHFLSKLAQSQIQDTTSPGPFRFCYCSTKWAIRGGSNKQSSFGRLLSFETQSRIMKGRVESALLSLASQSSNALVVYVFRPGTVVSRTTVTSLGGLASTVASAGLRVMPSVVTNVERVARVLVDASVGIRVEWQRGGPDGQDSKDTWESEEIVTWSLGLGV